MEQWSSAIFNQQRERKYKKSGNDHEYIIFNAVYLWSGIDGDRNAVRKSDSGVVRGVRRRAVLRISIHDDLFFSICESDTTGSVSILFVNAFNPVGSTRSVFPGTIR